MSNIFIKFIKVILRKLFVFFPKSVKNFYHEFRFNERYIDRTDVVVYTTSDIPMRFKNESLQLMNHFIETKTKVSLITTVLNEAESVNQWFSSILQQERRPDEIVIVDGGSSDGTIEKIQDIINTYPISVKLIKQHNVNIAEGRNIAVKNSTYSILAFTDFGCVLDPKWLALLTYPMESDPSIQVSMGYYKVFGQNVYANLSTLLFGIDHQAVNPQTFLPSSRSIAIRKEFFYQVGGYPEWLTRAGEDTVFDFQAKSIPAKWAFVPEAIVYWRHPNSLRRLLYTYYHYAKGDGESGIFADRYWYLVVKNTQKISATILFFFVAFIFALISLRFLYVFFIIWIVKEYFSLYYDSSAVRNRYGNLYLFFPILREFLGIVQIIGFTRGVLNRPKVRNRKISHYKNELSQIIRANTEHKKIIIYPPTHDWGFMFQRPQQIARSMARRGYLYFYCTQNERVDSVFGIQKIEENLFVCNVPFEVFSDVQHPIVYLGSAWNIKYLDYFTNPLVIYDHYDELEVSGASEKDHLALLHLSDIVLVSSEGLLEKVKEHRKDAIYIPNGVDYKFINSQKLDENNQSISDLEKIIEKGKPIIGYSGALAYWFDYELLSSVAEIRQDWDFILIGTNYDGSLENYNILEMPNIHWLGMKPYTTLFRYIAKFDVGIIPFRLIPITLSTSPIKLYEYLACGVPIVSTPLPECLKVKEVLVAEDRQSFINCIEYAIRLRNDVTYQQKLKEIAKQNTWDVRTRRIVARLHKLGY